MVQWVKDLALLQLWLRFDSWPRNFSHAVYEALKKKKKVTELCLNRTLNKTDVIKGALSRTSI